MFFSFLRYLRLFPNFFGYVGKQRVMRQSKFLTSEARTQTVTINILPDK